MKKSYLLIIIALCSIVISSNAQISGSKEYARLPYKSDILLKAYSLRIPLPENWGFQVPFLKENDAQLSIGTDIEYNFYLPVDSTLQQPVKFFFALPNKTEPCLELRITGFPCKEHGDLESEIGNWSKMDNVHIEKKEAYQKTLENRILTFYILAKDEAEKELCRQLIRSCKRYYDYEEYSEISQNHASITYEANDTTYYPSLGLGFVLDFEAQAEIYAKTWNINEAKTLVSVELDFDNENYSEYENSIVQAPGFNLQYRFLQNRGETEDILRDMAGYSSEYSLFDYSVAGIAAKVHVFGSSFAPSIIVELPTNNYTAFFSFSGVILKNADGVSKFLSQIYLDESIKVGLQTAELPTQSLAVLAGIKELGIEKLSLNKKLPKKTKTIICKYNDAGITIEAPVLDETRNTRMGDNATEVILESGYSTDSYTTYSHDYQDSYYLELFTNERMDELINEIFSLIDSQGMVFQKEGHVMVNDKKWILLTLMDESKRNYTFYYTPVGNDKTLCIISTSKDSKMEKIIEALLPKASFKN